MPLPIRVSLTKTAKSAVANRSALTGWGHGFYQSPNHGLTTAICDDDWFRGLNYHAEGKARGALKPLAIAHGTMTHAIIPAFNNDGHTTSGQPDPSDVTASPDYPFGSPPIAFAESPTPRRRPRTEATTGSSESGLTLAT